MQKPTLILLAAGRSSRLGSPKGLYPVFGRPWIETQLECFEKASGRKAVIVLGYDAEIYRTQLTWLEKKQFGTLSVDWVLNEAPERGPFSSLQCALESIDSNEGAWLSPVDIPLPRNWETLLLHAQPNGSIVIATHNGRKAHPVFLPNKFIKHLLQQPTSSRLDWEIGSWQNTTEAAIGEPEILLNLNTEAEFQSYLRNSVAD